MVDNPDEALFEDVPPPQSHLAAGLKRRALERAAFVKKLRWAAIAVVAVAASLVATMLYKSKRQPAPTPTQMPYTAPLKNPRLGLDAKQAGPYPITEAAPSFSQNPGTVLTADKLRFLRDFENQR